MPNEIEDSPGAAVIESTRRAADYKSVYANNTKFGISPFDFSFVFGEITESEEAKLYVDQRVKVIMTPLHAKLFLALLAKNMQNFEQQFGPINIPAPFLSNFEAIQPEADPKQ